MPIGGLSGGTPDYSNMRARMQEMISEKFQSGDADQNGSLSLKEFTKLHADRPHGPGGPEQSAGIPPRAEEIFARIDQNEDGQINEEEFLAGKPPAPQGQFSSDALDLLLGLQELASDLFDVVDQDRNGSLSLEEFKETKAPGRPGQAGGARSAEENFANLDQDSDGGVTLEELLSRRPQSPPPPPPGAVQGPSGHAPFESLAAILSAQEEQV